MAKIALENLGHETLPAAVSEGQPAAIARAPSAAQFILSARAAVKIAGGHGTG